ncbi:aquaporin Z [Streptococcus pneumoniae]|nr:aquaporin Z [Streptococcus pneumoniae]
MYQDLLRKIAEEKPNYNQEEIQWLLDHLGDPSPEIRDDLVFTSFAKEIQEELFTQEQFHFIAEVVLADGGLDKEIDKVGLSTLERSFRALVYANLLYADANQQSVFYQELNAGFRNVLLKRKGYNRFLKSVWLGSRFCTWSRFTDRGGLSSRPSYKQSS